MSEPTRADVRSAGGTLPRIAWLLAVLVPPSAVAGFWRDVVREHIGLAIGLFVAYATALMIGRFVAGFVRDLFRRKREKWIESTDQALSRRFTRFGAKYAEYVAGSLRFIDQKGLSTVGFSAPELDEVFVDVSLTLRAPGQIPGDLLAELSAYGETGERKSVQDFLGGPEPQVLAIIGSPGSGKTTLLRHTARHTCMSPRNRRRPVPILLYLRDHVEAITGDPSIGLAAVLRGELGRLAREEPPGWFEKRLEDGECTVLFDGLDEVADQRHRRQVADWVERQIRDYPGNDVVITSRPLGYQAAPVEGASVVWARPFTDEQVSTFVRSWYVAVERHASREDGEDVRLRAETGAEDLRARLRSSPNLYDLTVNPLLLTMIANVHRYRGALPGSRSDLYGEICQVMLWRRQESKKLRVAPRGRQKELLLRVLALEMMSRRVRDVSRDDCERILGPMLRRVSAELTLEDFLDDVGSNGLLVERENGIFAFAHFTFQEYLAAEHIREKGPVTLLTEAVDDDWWRECTLLYAANTDASPIVEACLGSDTVTALALAFDCAEEGNELDPDLQVRLNQLLDTDSADLPADRRRLIDGVLVTRQLGQAIRVADGGRLYSSAINGSVYEIFLRDSADRGEHRQPDGWHPGADGPVTGVRASDVAIFVKWVNNLVGGESLYRLPTKAEIEDTNTQSTLCHPTPGRPPLCFWLASAGDDDLPTLWVPGGQPHPHVVTSKQVLSHVDQDFATHPGTLVALLLIRARSAANVALTLLEDAGDLALDLALARLPDIAAALDAAIDAKVLNELDAGLALKAVPEWEDRRIPIVKAEIVDALDEAAVGDLVRALGQTVASDLATASSLAGGLKARTATRTATGRTATGVSKLAKVWTHTDALNHDIGKEWRRGLGFPRSARHPLLDLNTVRTDPGFAGLADALDLVYDLSFGRVLSRALRTVGTGAEPTTATAFARAFGAELTDVPTLERVDLDSLVKRTREDATMTGNLSSIGEIASAAWVGALARELEEHAIPAFSRQSVPTAAMTTRIRLLALCLSGATSGLRGQSKYAAHYQGLSERYWQLAATVTWLQLRHSGASQPVEAIALASD